jgi:predicted ATPase
VWLVELASIIDSRLVPDVIAAAFSLPARGDASLPAVVEYLATRDVLLVVDNCEHVLDETAASVEAILRRGPSVSVLATSREGLDVEGEHIVPVSPLVVDEGIDLFIDRATAATPDASFSGHARADVAEIVQRLDGIPLALELAAARMRSMPVAELATRIGDRFDLLGRRRGSRRHQTLRAAIDWSHHLLDTEEVVVFRRLSCFAGGFTLEAAQIVIADGVIEAPAVFDAVRSSAYRIATPIASCSLPSEHTTD